MAERTKYIVPATKWARWTGDNSAELEAFFADEMAERNVTLSVDGQGNLSSTDGFFHEWAGPVPEGHWFTFGGLSFPSDADFQATLGRTQVEIPETGLMPE